jgi:hypothetical protein
LAASIGGLTFWIQIVPLATARPTIATTAPTSR